MNKAGRTAAYKQSLDGRITQEAQQVFGLLPDFQQDLFYPLSGNTTFGIEVAIGAFLFTKGYVYIEGETGG